MKKIIPIALLVLVALGGLNVWSAVHFRSVRDAAMVAGSELRECARLADELRQLKQRPMVAGTEEFASKELSTLVRSRRRRDSRKQPASYLSGIPVSNRRYSVLAKANTGSVTAGDAVPAICVTSRS